MRKVTEWLSNQLDDPKEKAKRLVLQGRCRCCGDRFPNKKELLEHYAYRHPDVSYGWVLGEKEEGVE